MCILRERVGLQQMFIPNPLVTSDDCSEVDADDAAISSLLVKA